VTAFAVIVAAYLVGSVPIAWIAGRMTAGVDLREYGSGNVGASNVWQSASRWLTVPVGVAQIAQGAAGVAIAKAFDQPEGVQVAAGLVAVVANDWNPWLGFTGGRGVGQAIGILLMFSPVALGVFIIVALLGVALRAIPQFVALGLVLAPAGALLASQSMTIFAGALLLAAVVLIKRVAANGAPAAEYARPQVWLFRLLYDRDVRDRDAWVRRGLPG
jgi:acyl phosphate:glycerol-3-phosphate acyltransferase